MKLQLVPNSLTHGDIVDFFSYIYQYSWVGEVKYSKQIKYDDNDCLEDKIAKTLLSGKKITMRVDDPDEGDDGDYSKTIKISIVDIEKGINILSEKCPNCYNDLLNDYTADMETYDALMQCVIFGDIIYG